MLYMSLFVGLLSDVHDVCAYASHFQLIPYQLRQTLLFYSIQMRSVKVDIRMYIYIVLFSHIRRVVLWLLCHYYRSVYVRKNVTC